MKLDLNLIKHNYIIRLVIFSVFLFRSKRSDHDKYKFLIQAFLRKKISKDFQIFIDCGEKLTAKEHRNNVIDQILYQDNLDYNNLIEVRFRTPLKEINLQIDLTREDKYEEFLYL